jgi:hypothetical protein
MTDFIYIHIGGHCDMYFAQTHRDHDGNVHRPHWKIATGKGVEAIEHKDAITLYSGDLILPCSRDVTTRLRDFTQMQQLLQHAHGELPTKNMFGPYYYTIDMSGMRRFEGENPEPHFIGGPDTAYAETLASQSRSWLQRLFGSHAKHGEDREKKPVVHASLNPEGFYYARYNCWTIVQGLAQYIGGIDLAQVAPRLVSAYRAHQATDEKDRMLRSMKRPIKHEFKTIHHGDGFRIVRRGDNPPFIVTTDYSTNTKDILAAPGPGGMTVGDWFETQDNFSARPVAHHAHMAPARTVWQKLLSPA